MTVTSLARAAALAAFMAALAGCGSISSTLGLERHVPDETQVVVRPALTLPPDYSLMPPGTETPVSADHEGARSISGANDMAPVPPKEEKGFISRVFSFDWFGDDSDSDVPKSPAPSVEGTPAAPDAAPPAAPPAKP